METRNAWPRGTRLGSGFCERQLSRAELYSLTGAPALAFVRLPTATDWSHRAGGDHADTLGASIAAQTASKSQSPAGFAAFAFRWSRWPAFARSCTIHAV